MSRNGESSGRKLVNRRNIDRDDVFEDRQLDGTRRDRQRSHRQLLVEIFSNGRRLSEDEEIREVKSRTAYTEEESDDEEIYEDGE